MNPRFLKLVAVVGLTCPMLWSQSSVPAPLSGDAVRPTLTGESRATNTLTTTLRVSTEVDDNALNDNSAKLTDSITRFDPTFAWDLSRKRWSFQTEYTPGVSYSLELPRYRNVSHALRNSVNFGLAQHLNLRLRNSFRRTSDPFDSAGAFTDAQTVPAYGVLDSTNPSYLGRPTLLTSNQSGLDLVYQPAAHTTVGVSGSYAITMYEDLVPGATFNRDTHVASGRAFVDQKLSPRQSVSVAYNYSVITSAAFGRTVAHSVLLFDSWTLNPKVSLSVFAGPEYTDVHYGSVLSPIALEPGWGWSAGGTLAWHGEKTGLSGNVVRRISDGGGLGGAVQMTNVSAILSRKLGKAWNATLNAAYTLNGSNTFASSQGAISYVTAGGGLSRRIGKNFSIDGRYAYTHQDRSSTTTPFGFLADHNRFSVGLSYTFSNRLGI